MVLSLFLNYLISEGLEIMQKYMPIVLKSILFTIKKLFPAKK